MKLYHSDNETGVTLSDRDRDVIRAGADAADSLLELARAFGVGPLADDDPDLSKCNECSRMRDTRPLVMWDDAGNKVVRQVCGDCQAQIIRHDVEADAEGGDAGGSFDPSEFDFPQPGGGGGG